MHLLLQERAFSVVLHNKQAASQAQVFLQMAKWVKAENLWKDILVLNSDIEICFHCLVWCIQKKKNWTKNILFSSTYLKAAPLIAEDHEA